MKQFTTPEQTAKLIELGFEKPMWRVARKFDDQPPRKCITSFGVLMTASYEDVFAYSIGELIEMLPQKITLDDCIHSRVVSENEVSYYSWELETYFCICDDNSQLVDNLFDAIVKLKEEGVI